MSLAPHGSSTPASVANLDHPPGSRQLPVAAAEYHAPAGRRRLGVVLVRVCPYCRRLHLHRAGSPAAVDGARRTGSCGRTYLVRVRSSLRGAA